MKKIQSIISALVLLPVLSFAQIPNGNFENWKTISNYDIPDGWATMNSWNSSSCQQVEESYPAGTGMFSVRITNDTARSQQQGGWGIIGTGPFNFPVKPSFPISVEPKKVYGYYKFIAEGDDDSATIAFFLFKNGVEVNNGGIYLPPANAWTPFEESIEYFQNSAVAVDSAYIMIFAYKSEGPASEPLGNSSFYLDNLSFDGLVTSKNEVTTKTEFSIFPNPAAEQIIVRIADDHQGFRAYNIYNAMGQVVQAGFIQEAESNINTTQIPTGLYFLSVDGLFEKHRIAISR